LAKKEVLILIKFMVLILLKSLSLKLELKILFWDDFMDSTPLFWRMGRLGAEKHLQ